MAHRVVKITTSDDGEVQKFAKWHLSIVHDGSPRALCAGECYGIGEGSAVYKTKTVEKGGVTCDNCIEIIKAMKAIKL